jgi:hypothetical protein
MVFRMAQKRRCFVCGEVTILNVGVRAVGPVKVPLGGPRTGSYSRVKATDEYRHPDCRLPALGYLSCAAN